jgi:hypothetical protein
VADLLSTGLVLQLNEHLGGTDSDQLPRAVSYLDLILSLCGHQDRKQDWNQPLREIA